MVVSGFEVICLEEVGSTNDIAAEYAAIYPEHKLVIRARRQTAGRGRRGRSWQSLEGNLFFSMLFEFSLRDLGRLIMAASLSLVDVVKAYKPDADVRLKWPNDVLLNGNKISGMLLEKGAGNYMIVGIGVNITQSPQMPDMLYPTTSLAQAGIAATADDFLQKYLGVFAKNIDLTAASLRQRWLENAKNVGAKIKVLQNGKEQRGIFEGIDDNADLILRTDGGVQKILAGDVFYLGDENGGF